MMVAHFATGCSLLPTDEPALNEITPSEVSAVRSTPVAIEGEHLYDPLRVTLHSSAAPDVHRKWKVKIGDRTMGSVEHPDPETLRFVVPAGMAPGQYDVVAFSPRGQKLALGRKLTVVDDADTEPTQQERLAIEDAPGGAGAPVGDRTLTIDAALTLYAVVRDENGAFVRDELVDWSTTDGLGAQPSTGSGQFELARSQPGEGRVQIAHALGAAETGLIRFVPGAAREIAIQPRTATLTVGGSPLQFTLTARDRAGNLTESVGDVVWEVSSGPIGALSATGQLTPQSAGTGKISARSAAGLTAETDDVSVVAGPASQLVIQPATATLPAGSEPLQFTVSARDVHDNPTTDLGTLQWRVESGPIGSLDASSGTLTPITAGAGRVELTSSHGASAITGTITIRPGRAASLSIQPPTLVAMVGDPATEFRAVGQDSLGNVTTDVGTLTYAIASGPITQLDTSTGNFTPLGTGTGTLSVTSSYGLSAVSGDVRVDPYLSRVQIVSLSAPQETWQGATKVRFALEVENASPQEAWISGLWLTFRSGSDVSSQYTVRGSSNNPARIAPNTTQPFVMYADVDMFASLGTITATATVESWPPRPVLGFARASRSTNFLMSTTLTLPSVEMDAPNIPKNRVCAPGAVKFEPESTLLLDNDYRWIFETPAPMTSSADEPTIQYTEPGAFTYHVTASNLLGRKNSAVGPEPIFAGTHEADPRDTYPTGSVLFSEPDPGDQVDMTSLPRTLIDMGETTAEQLLQCDGTPVADEGSKYVTLFVDRGRIPQSEDDRPDLPGIQILLNSGTGHFDDVLFENDAFGLEGPAMLYGEFFHPGHERVTAAGFAEFRMSNDRVRPTVVATVPAADCDNGCYGKGQPFLFQFSEPIDPSNLNSLTVQRMSGTSCTGPTSGSINSTVTYDAASRTLRVVPATLSASSYAVRVTIGASITDTSANANTLGSNVRCAGLTALAATATPAMPQVAAAGASVISPDGDGVDDVTSWSATADGATQRLLVQVRRGPTVVWAEMVPATTAGSYIVAWNGRDYTGRVVPNGFYRVDVTAYNADDVASPTASSVIEVASAVHFTGVLQRF